MCNRVVIINISENKYQLNIIALLILTFNIVVMYQMRGFPEYSIIWEICFLEKSN